MAYTNLYPISNIAFFDYRLNCLKVNEVMRDIRSYVENELMGKIEHCPISIFNKIIQVIKLKKKFLSFAKEHDNDERELYILFIEKFVSELMHNVNKWAKIFVTEKEDRTNKKHRKHIKEMLPHLNKISEISTFFVQRGNRTMASVSPSTIRMGLKGKL